MRQKRHILAVSFVLLAFFSCGKKGNPVPKGLPVPAPINDLRGEVRDDVLMLSFSIPTKNMDGSPIKDLAGFRILRNCGGCGAGFELWKDIRLTDKQGYTIRDGRLYTYDNDLMEGFDYGYRVFSETSKSVLSDGSNTFSIKWLAPPGPPRTVDVLEEDSEIVLSWQATSGLLYNVYRWEDGVYPLFPLNASPLSATRFTDKNLQNGKQYKYEVRAVRVESGVVYEGSGAVVLATPRDKTPPAPPTSLKLERKDGTVFLTWSPNEEHDLAGYNVYRTAAGKTAKINASEILGTSFPDTTPGTLPYVSYYVTAVDKAGNESGPSQERTIILKD